MACVYLKSFRLLSESAEYNFLLSQKMTCYNGYYPYGLFPKKGLRELQFEPVTILYGGNGSGKTTLLNLIAEKLHLPRASAFNGSPFFARYAESCEADATTIPSSSRILTSDDVFDTLLSVRDVNDGINRRRDDLFEDYVERRYDTTPNRLKSLDDTDLEEFRKTLEARRRTKSRFVNERLHRNVDVFSNGEAAMRYFMQNISENALYLLDEPENSLSVARQEELSGFLTDSARHFGCQFVISTHSPVLLGMESVRIYDLDANPVVTRKWTELENVRRFFTFFESRRQEFLRDMGSDGD